jgi:hypothetical protein
MLKKICKRCQSSLDIKEFYQSTCARTQITTTHNLCKRCFSEVSDIYYEKEKAERKNPKFRAKYIVKDARTTDARRGRSNDLTLDWVQEVISKGCNYCGETKLQMTLDRIDNDKAHTRDNVVPACVRCNFIRKTMPYSAWLLLVNGVKKAKETGAFGDWTGAIRGHSGRTRITQGIKKPKPRFSFKAEREKYNKETTINSIDQKKCKDIMEELEELFQEPNENLGK